MATEPCHACLRSGSDEWLHWVAFHAPAHWLTDEPTPKADVRTAAEYLALDIARRWGGRLSAKQTEDLADLVGLDPIDIDHLLAHPDLGQIVRRRTDLNRLIERSSDGQAA